jgi:hypothetical protein
MKLRGNVTNDQEIPMVSVKKPLDSLPPPIAVSILVITAQNQDAAHLFPVNILVGILSGQIRNQRSLMASGFV